MPKKTLFIITGSVLSIVLLLGGWFFYSASQGKTPVSNIISVLKKASPFGEADPFGIKKVLDTVKNSIPGQNSDTNSSISEESSQLLYKLSTERSSGIDFAEVLVPRTREVLKRITIDDPRVASSSVPRKIQTLATTTETYFATTTRIRYVEQGSGHIYEYDFASSTTRKLTNTTIPKTQEAYFLDNGNKVLLRYLDASNRQIENYLATIPVSSVADSLSGIFLSNRITDISVSPSTSEFFYLAKSTTGSLGNIYNLRTNTERRVFNSAFSEWLSVWSKDSIYLTTKPSNKIKGYLYSQSLLKDAFTRVTGNILGLTTLASPDGKKVLLAEGSVLSILDITSGQLLNVAGIFTLPEKCTWLNTSEIICFGSEQETITNLPDSWYQGLSYFNDSLFSISTTDGSVVKLATMPELYTKDVSIDAIRPRLSKDASSIVFLNKIDMTPWYLNISGVYNFIQPETE